MEARLVIFDCDGVLIDSERIANRVGAELKTEMGMSISVEDHIERFCGLEHDTPEYKRILAGLPPAYAAISYERKMKAFQEELKAMPGIRDLLNTMNLPYCLATNGSRDITDHKLMLAGLQSFFMPNQRFTGDLVNRKKPAPDLYLMVADRHQIEPKKCIVVEDSIPGIMAAQAAGMPVYAFIGGSHISSTHASKIEALRPAHILKDLRELNSVLNHRT